MLLILAVGGVLLAGRAGGGDAAIAEANARLVPDDALVYVHLSTDRDREAVRDAQRLAQKFPSFARLRDAILRRLSVNGDAGELGEWLGDEASLALLDSKSGTAGSLVVVDVRDEAAARRFLAEGRGTQSAQRYHGVPVEHYGQVMAAFVAGDVVIGQLETVHQAIDLAQGRGRSLGADPQFQRTQKGLPADRFADGYVTSGGVRRLLAPAGGLLGAVGTLLDRPNLRATGLALTAGDPGARLFVHTLTGPGAFAPFAPRLLADAPAGALAYIGVRGFDRTAARLLAATGTDSQALARIIGAIPRELIVPLQGEVALLLTAPANRTVLTVVAHAGSEARTRAALDKLSVPGTKVTHTTAGGQPVTVLRAGRSFELYAAVYDGKLVVSTDAAGIASARGDGALQRSEAFRRVVPETDGRVTAVGFLDFDQLLKLAERTGLEQSRAYQGVRADLQRVRAVGFSSSGTEGDTTAEIRFDIP